MHGVLGLGSVQPEYACCTLKSACIIVKLQIYCKSIQNCPWFVFIAKSIQASSRPNLWNLDSCALDPPFCCLTLSQRSFYLYAPTLWNYLPEEIVQWKSFSSFKTAVHTHLVQSLCASSSFVWSCLVCHIPCCFLVIFLSVPFFTLFGVFGHPFNLSFVNIGLCLAWCQMLLINK